MMKKLNYLLAALFLSLVMTAEMSAQDLNAAGKALNKGIELSGEGDIEGAIASYTDCINIASELGEEGAELKTKASTQVASLYMKMGADLYKAKNFESAINAFANSARYADLAGNEELAGKARNYFAITYTGEGNTLLRTKKYEQAIESYKKALEHDPDFVKALYGLSLGYSKTDEGGKMEESVARIIEISDDEKTISKSKTIASKYFLKVCVDAIKEENYNVASMMATKSIEYDEKESSAYYYLALSNNANKNWQQAQQAALKGLGFEEKDKSNLYFELGRAYEGMGDATNACDSYAKVASGPNMEAAKYQREQVLKCQ